MNLVTTILAEALPLPPIAALGYEYVVAANGLFIRAENPFLEACIPIGPVVRPLSGLVSLEPVARLKVPRVPGHLLHAIYENACEALPNEAMYQILYSPLARNALNGWAVARPAQHATPVGVTFADTFGTAIDLHSHGHMEPFFSETDDADETGLRFYCVIGCLKMRHVFWMSPIIICRIGVFGHTYPVPATTIFDTLDEIAFNIF